MLVIAGAALGLVMTLVVAAFFGFGQRPGTGAGLAFRFIAEVALIAGALIALVATVSLGTPAACDTVFGSLFGGYITIRVVAVILEVLTSK